MPAILIWPACLPDLACLPSWYGSSLRRENQVELSAATWLVASLLIFDISVLLTSSDALSGLLRTAHIPSGACLLRMTDGVP